MLADTMVFYFSNVQVVYFSSSTCTIIRLSRTYYSYRKYDYNTTLYIIIIRVCYQEKRKEKREKKKEKSKNHVNI